MSITCLIKFGQEVANSITHFKSNGHPGVEKIEYEYRPIKNLDHRFEDEIHFIPDRENYKRFFVYEWQSKALTDFLENHIKGTTLYNKALEYIYEITLPLSVIDDPSVFRNYVEKYVLHRYACFLCKKTIQDSFQLSHLNDYARIIENDITKGKPLIFTATMYIVGFNIEDNQLNLGNDLHIRGLTPTDLSSTTSDLYEHELDKITGRSTDVLSAIELKHSVPNPLNTQIGTTVKNDLIQILENVLKAIRLFSLTNAYPPRTSFQVESILYPIFDDEIPRPLSNYIEKGISPNDRSLYYYTLKTSRIPQFVQLYQKLSSSLFNTGPEPHFEAKPHELAYIRYCDALLGSTDNIKRLFGAIFTLDVAFVRDSERHNSKDKLLTRAARLISWVSGEDMKQVRCQFESAYDIRNKVAHGRNLASEQIDFARKNTRAVLKQVRMAISIMFQLYPEMDKDLLIDTIERAQKEPQVLKNFKQTLNELVILT